MVSVKTGPDGETGRIALADGSVFSFRNAYLPPPQGEVFFCPGQELDGEEEGALRFAAACYRAEKGALRLIARAEQTRAGLARKLERRGHAAAVVRAVTARLAELRILDDRRYAALWIRSRLNRGAAAPFKLIQGLCSRGIEREDAAGALKAALDGEGELELLRRYLARRFPRFEENAGPPLRYMLRQAGFSGRAIGALWEEL